MVEGSLAARDCTGGGIVGLSIAFSPSQGLGTISGSPAHRTRFAGAYRRPGRKSRRVLRAVRERVAQTLSYCSQRLYGPRLTCHHQRRADDRRARIGNVPHHAGRRRGRNPPHEHGRRTARRAARPPARLLRAGTAGRRRQPDARQVRRRPAANARSSAWCRFSRAARKTIRS